ncbi:LacI family DNA-binding transcriptional regulator [candidate division KSB1 bacterium]|nr:LacI family DNA-binding transcriptional regulator [candidate division KSB1 bacterium]
MSESNKPVTLKTIASVLNLTTASVSKALRDSPDISEETRRRVKEKARELGYHPKIMARSLSQRRSYILGVIVPDLRISFFSEAVRGMYEQARTYGYEVIILVHDENATNERRNLEFLAALQVDAILLDAVPGTQNNDVIYLIKNRGIPLVCYDRRIDGMEFPSVTINDEVASQQIIQYFFEQGRRKFMFLGPTRDLYVVKGRYNGYRKALEKLNLPYQPELLVPCKIDDTDAFAKMKDTLSAGIEFDAVMCVGGLVAYGAGKALQEYGFTIPVDVMLAEFGDNNIVHKLGVPFVTVDQSPYKMGMTAIDMVVEYLTQNGVLKQQHVVMETRLITYHSHLPNNSISMLKRT